MGFRALRECVLLGLLAWLQGCGGDGGPEATNLIVLSIDTLRADRLGCYGYERGTTPVIDAFARRAVVFEQAVAESPWTIPSHFTMLSGLYPTSHGVRQPGQRPSAQTRLLAEILRDEGYYTFAITDGGWLSEELGFGRGFLGFRGRRRGFATTLGEARETIASLLGKRPFFAFLHTFDVHCPYEPPEPFAGLFRSEGSEPLATEGRCGNPHFNRMDLSPPQARYLSDRYDGGVRKADQDLADFLRFLEESGALENTVVILTSDHGEEFLEHGRIGHEETLFREVLMVPLLVAAPGVTPRRIDEPVGLVDIVPTALDLLDLAPPGELDGTSLASLLRGAGPPAADRGFRLSELDRGVRLRSWMGRAAHLIVNPDTGERRLFDLRSDPLERIDLAAAREELADELTGDLEAFLQTLAPRPVLEGEALGGRVLEELGELGYTDRD